MQDGEFVSESVSSSVSSSDSSSHYPQALSHALSMLGLPELLLKEEQKLAIRAVFDGKDKLMFVPLLSRDLKGSPQRRSGQLFEASNVCSCLLQGNYSPLASLTDV